MQKNCCQSSIQVCSDCFFVAFLQELSITYSSSSGPGGQNVNKTSTKVDIRFHMESANWLTSEVKAVLSEKMASDLTKDGWIVVKSDRTRSQSLNQADALEKLRGSIREALQPPKPKFTAEQEESIRKGKIKASRSKPQDIWSTIDFYQYFTILIISGSDSTRRGFEVIQKRAEEVLVERG